MQNLACLLVKVCSSTCCHPAAKPILAKTFSAKSDLRGAPCFLEALGTGCWLQAPSALFQMDHCPACSNHHISMHGARGMYSPYWCQSINHFNVLSICQSLFGWAAPLCSRRKRCSSHSHGQQATPSWSKVHKCLKRGTSGPRTSAALDIDLVLASSHLAVNGVRPNVRMQSETHRKITVWTVEVVSTSKFL